MLQERLLFSGSSHQKSRADLLGSQSFGCRGIFGHLRDTVGI